MPPGYTGETPPDCEPIVAPYPPLDMPTTKEMNFAMHGYIAGFVTAAILAGIAWGIWG